MSWILSPTLSIEQIKRNNALNNSIKLNSEYIQKNSDDYFLPSFDFYTDIKFLTNSNASYFFKSNPNPYGLSKLSIDKYKNMNISNPQSIEGKRKIETEANDDKNVKDLEKKKENLDKETENIPKNKNIKYKKLNNKKNPPLINKNRLEEVNKKEEDIEIGNINNNLKVSSILNETIGENIYSQNNKNNSHLNNNDNLIDYLKKENDDLKRCKERNNQIINSLFYFVNQLSQKYSPDKKIFDLSYYNSNINCLLPDLNNLNEFIDNQNKAKENSNNISINNLSKKEEKSKTIEIKMEIERNKQKNNNDIIFDRTFTFGQNDSFNKNNKRNISKKLNKIKKINKLINSFLNYNLLFL